MVGLISLFIVVIASLLVSRVATTMLVLTGLSKDIAEFQARSAFYGVGFTTIESELVMNDPLRRQIVMTLGLLGNAGVFTVLVSLVLSFNNVDNSGQALQRMGLLAGGLTIVWLFSTSKIADRWLTRLIEALLRRVTHLDTRDYVGLLRLTNDWMVGEIKVEAGAWLADVPLRDLDLPEEGVVVLGIDRADKRWVGAPTGTAALHEGDVVVVYGTREAIDRVGRRRRDSDGELDRLTAQVDFTERYLEQQSMEKSRGEDITGEVPIIEPKLTVGEKIDDHGDDTSPPLR